MKQILNYLIEEKYNYQINWKDEPYTETIISVLDILIERAKKKLNLEEINNGNQSKI